MKYLKTVTSGSTESWSGKGIVKAAINMGNQ
jgi:hypothetical protein